VKRSPDTDEEGREARPEYVDRATFVGRRSPSLAGGLPSRRAVCSDCLGRSKAQKKEDEGAGDMKRTRVHLAGRADL